MAIEYLPCDRDQLFLMPESMRDWLAEDHLAWLVLDLVATVDTAQLHDRYRLGGVGRAPYHPDMLLALLVYAYCVGVRSSREIERRCRSDVAFRVLAANHIPDHTTIARFRQLLGDVVHQLFTDVLELCAAAGMARVGVVALDGTKMEANAALSANRTRAWIEAEVARLLAEADQTDAAEDASVGDARGDELPAGLDRHGARLGRLQECLHQLDQQRAAAEAQAAAKIQARAAKEAAAAVQGRRLRGRRPSAPVPVDDTDRRANPTDPDSRIMKTRHGFTQAYNAQTVVSEDQVVIAAAVTQDAVDTHQFVPMIQAAQQMLSTVGIDEPMGTVLADAGYFTDANITAFDDDGPQVLVNTTTAYAAVRAARTQGFVTGDPPEGATPRQRMQHRLRTEDGHALYAQRAGTVEPVYADTKDRRGFRRFMRRGRRAVDEEWQLMCATHNLRKVYRLRTGLFAALGIRIVRA